MLLVFPSPDIARQATGSTASRDAGGKFTAVAPVKPVSAVPATQDDVLRFRHDQLLQQNMRAPAAYLTQRIAQMAPDKQTRPAVSATDAYTRQATYSEQENPAEKQSILA